MHKIEIPIWQDPDAKPIEGLPPMPKTITKWFRTEEEYKEYMKPTILDSGFNEKPKDRTGIVHIGKDRKIEKVVCDD